MSFHAASQPLGSCGLQVCNPASCLGLFSEKYNPPANLTVKHNVSHYVIRWDAPAIRYSLSNSVLRYALDIQKTVRTRTCVGGLGLPPSAPLALGPAPRPHTHTRTSLLASRLSSVRRPLLSLCPKSAAHSS